MVCLSIVLGIFLPGILWASWICGLVSDIYFGKVLGRYCFKYLLFFSSFPSDTSISHVILSVVVPQPLNILFFGWLVVFFNPCSLCFSVFEDSIDRPSSSEIPQPKSSIKDSKHTYPLLWRETLLLPWGYTDILEKIMQNKGSKCLHSQDTPKKKKKKRHA